MEATRLDFGDPADITEAFITSKHHSVSGDAYNGGENGAECAFDLLQTQTIGMMNGVFCVDHYWLGDPQGDIKDGKGVFTINQRITSVSAVLIVRAVCKITL